MVLYATARIYGDEGCVGKIYHETDSVNIGANADLCFNGSL